MDKLAQLRKWLEGNKTYIGLMFLGLTGLAYSQGWISQQTAEATAGVVGLATGIAFKIGQNRIESKIDALPSNKETAV